MIIKGIKAEYEKQIIEHDSVPYNPTASETTTFYNDLAAQIGGSIGNAFLRTFLFKKDTCQYLLSNLDLLCWYAFDATYVNWASEQTIEEELPPSPTLAKIPTSPDLQPNDDTIVPLIEAFLIEKNKSGRNRDLELQSIFAEKTIDYIAHEHRESIEDSQNLREQLGTLLFEKILYGEAAKDPSSRFADEISPATYLEIKEVQNQEKYPYHHRVLVVAALTLSMVQRFTADKAKTLLEFIHANEPLVWKKALVGWVLGTQGKEQIIQQNPTLANPLKALLKSEEIQLALNEIVSGLNDIGKESEATVLKAFKDVILRLPEFE